MSALNAGRTGRFSPEALRELEEIISHYPERRAAMLPALWIAQREYGGALTRDAIEEVARLLGRPAVEVEGVASFYTMYNLGRRGRRHLEVCTCLTCAVVGAAGVLRKLEERLGVCVGEVTPDGEFSLSEAECLNWCEAGTVVQVGDRYFGNVTPDNVEDLLAEITSGEGAGVVQQADSVVQVHLRRKGAPAGGTGRG